MNAGAAPNLASELLAARYTFGGFSEDLPTVGSAACSAGKYARKHVPWANFTNVPAANSVPFSAFNARTDYASLPTVSFVIPNLDNDMHDGTITQADSWLNSNLSHYANWAVANNSLSDHHVRRGRWRREKPDTDVIYGAHVKPGSYSEPISHYNVLSTIEEMYGLPKTGLAANAPAITDIWALGGRGLAAADELAWTCSGRFAVLDDDVTRDDRRDVPVGRLVETPATGGKVVDDRRPVQLQSVVVDDVQIGLVAHRDSAAVGQARDPGGHRRQLA